MPLVSIIVPVYNVEKYLSECLNSLISQTLSDIEIIVVDDGSSDGSGIIADEFGKKDERIIIIHQENSGYGKAVNNGIHNASGEYIGIVESDDWIEPDTYRSLYDIAKEYDLDVIKSDHIEFYYNDDNLIEKHIPLAGSGRLKKYYNRIICPREEQEILRLSKYTWSGIYKKSFLERHGILHNETPGAAYQDNGFWFQTLAMSDRVFFLDKAYYHYRVDNPNASYFNRGNPYAEWKEFEFIINTLKTKDDNIQAFLKWAYYYQVLNGCFAISRVDKKDRLSLAEDIREKVLDMFSLRKIDADLFSITEKERVFYLLADPGKAVEIFTENTGKIVSLLEPYKNIVIYGAGKIGRAVLAKTDIDRIHTRIRCFAVSSMIGNPSEIEGIPVKSINDIELDKEDTVIIIGVGESAKSSILSGLKKSGWNNTMDVERIWR